MRLSRRLATITAALALALTTAGVAGTAEARPRPPKPKELQLQVLSFNDFHGHLQPPGGTDATLGATLDPTNTQVGGAEYLASTLEGLRAKARYSQTVAAGDLIGGSPFLSGLFHDEPAVESLNAMGLDVSSVGNHEFDEGVDELLRMQRGGCHPEDGCYEPWGEDGYPGADFPWLAANVVGRDTGRTILPGTTIRKVRGCQGRLHRDDPGGHARPWSPSPASRASSSGTRWRRPTGPPASCAARACRRSSCCCTRAASRPGPTGTASGSPAPSSTSPRTCTPRSTWWSPATPTSPTSATSPTRPGRTGWSPRPRPSAGWSPRPTLVINTRTGEVKRDKTTATNHLVTRTTADPEQTEIINRWNAAAAPIANEVVGSITADIVRSPNRDTEGPLANLIADAQLAATAAPGNGGAQIAFMNPGGVRADLDYEPDLRRRAAGRGHLRRGVRGAAVRQPAGHHGPDRRADRAAARAAGHRRADPAGATS